MIRATPELLQHLIAEGYNNQAVAAYGNSVEFLRRALISGEIPWNAPQPGQDLLDYQKRLLSKGGYLYYAHPFVENLQPHKPSLVEKLRSAPNVDLTQDAMRRSLCFYAATNAISHYFESQVSTQPACPACCDKIIGLTYLLFPDLVEKFKDDETLSFFFSDFINNARWKNPSSLGLERSNIPLSRLKEILAQSISKRGLIMYYRSVILSNRVIPGSESEDEIIIYSRKPLTLEVISGIEPLAEADKKAVEGLIQSLKD